MQANEKTNTFDDTDSQIAGKKPHTDDRILAESVVIPEICGEMVKLRAATWEDFTQMEQLDAFSSSLTLVGKTEKAERDIVRSLVQRSLRWQKGIRTQEEGLQDAEARGVMAWSIFARNENDQAETGDVDNQDTPTPSEELLGMAFLVDIDAWAASARIQVILGENYRGRGYTRDVMPRVMTFGFAPRPAGLGLHRIWISTPSVNTRAHAVYQSLGFVESGISRDAQWDDNEQRYMDMHVFDMLVDEYDPIHSLETFGLHAIMDNPGVREALAQHERTLELKKHVTSEERDLSVTNKEVRKTTIGENDESIEDLQVRLGESEQEGDKAEPDLPWWRKLGAGRKRD
ncbi:GNAT family N-acetyltransferase [Alloscardovia criceti]|uniref:GNAT family N-acetyltransferase n=1 Tax=Alloscardovia criceti TaxID=356828 RepID=UPI00036D1F79|nr:GNAT family protein [Alloscardovia criceti]